jgi:hypothetical protein
VKRESKGKMGRKWKWKWKWRGKWDESERINRTKVKEREAKKKLSFAKKSLIFFFAIPQSAAVIYYHVIHVI